MKKKKERKKREKNKQMKLRKCLHVIGKKK